MWIRSQYKEILTNCNDFYIDKIYSSYTIMGNKGILGSYSTKEKAMKVLDMIERYIISEIDIKRGYNPCSMEYNESYYVNKEVFQMPKNDEVK